MKKRLIKALLFVGLLFIGLSRVHADSISFKIDGASVKVGDTFIVNVSVSGADEVYTLSDYDLTVSYDTAKLELVEGNSQISASGQQITEEKVLTPLTFRAIASTDGTKLELTGSVKINGEKPGEKIKVNYNSSTVTIRNIGTNSTLKSLKIPNAVLSPEFNENIHDYKATVTDVTSVEIKAVPSDDNSSISVTPNASNLVKGDNDVTVVCRAEDGRSESTYTIRVTLNVTPTEEELKAQDTTLKTLTIKGQKIEFVPTEKKYYINVDYDTTKITINAAPTTPEAEVVITGDSKLIVGKNTVKITVTSADKSKTDTYQIIVTRADEEKKIVQTCPDETSKTEWIIYTVSLLVTFTLGIVLGYFLGKKNVFGKLFKKKKKAPEEAVEIETLSDTIDLTNTIKKTKEVKKEEKEK